MVTAFRGLDRVKVVDVVGVVDCDEDGLAILRLESIKCSRFKKMVLRKEGFSSRESST